MAEFEDISDDSYSDSDILPGTPPPRIYPAAFPSWASASGEAAVAAAAARAIQDPAIDSSDFSQDDVRPTQPSNPPVEIPGDLGETQWVQNPERKVKVEEEMEGESPPSKKLVFGSSPSTSLSLTEQQTEETLVSPILSPAENEPVLYEFSSPEQSSSRSLDFLFEDQSTWESSPPPSYKSFVPESPSRLENQDDSQPCEPDSQSSPTTRAPQPEPPEPLDEDLEPCTSTFQVQRTPYREVSPPEEESLEEESDCRVSSTAQPAQSPFSACLFDDDSDSEFFFSLVHGKVLPASPTMDQKLGLKFSLSAQESPSHSFNFLFEEDSTSECSSDVAQDIPLPELLLLGTESDRECSYSQFSPPKAAQVKPLGNMFPEASSFATSSQGEGPLSEALAILKTQQTAAFSPSTEIAYRRALDYLFENKPIWEPPSPDDKILVPNTPSPQRKKVVSGLLLSERHKTSRTWSLGDPLEDISSREPSPSGAHEALAPEAFLSTKVTVYEFPPTEPVSPPSTSLDVLFEDTSIHEFSSQIHEVAPEFPAAVRKKPVYEFSPSKVRPLPSQRSLDFLLEDQAAFEPSSQAHDSDFSESPPLVAKKLVFEVSPQASPRPSSPDFLFEDDIPGSSYPSFLLDDDILRPSSHDFLLDDELPGPSYRSYLLDDELPGPSYRSYLIDDELPGPSYRSYLIDDELPGPSYRSYLIDDEVPGPSSSSFLVEEEKARFSSPDFPIEEEETLDYTSLLYNRSVSPHSLGKKSVFAPSPNTCSAQTIPYIDSLNFLIDDKSAGEPLSQAQEMLSSESPMLGRKLGYEFKPLDLLFEEGSSPEAASIPIHSLVIPATSPGEKYLPQYKSPDFMYEDPSAFQYFPSGVHDLVFPDMTSGIDNYGSQFASSRAQIVTSPSSLDFLFQDQLTGDPSSPDPVILLPGSPDSVGERPIFEFFSSQEEKTFCDSTSDQGRLFYDVPLSQNQELEPESSFRAEQRVAEAFSSHVFFPFEEEMMPVGGDLTSQVSEEQVYECSSTCMPESTDTEATPPQDSDDDDDEEEDDNDEDVSNDEDGDKDHDKDSSKDDGDRDDGGGDDGGDGDDEDGGDGGKEGDDGGKEGSDRSKEGGYGGKEGGDGGKEGGNGGKEGSDGGKEDGNGGKEDGGDVNKDSGDIDENGSNVGDKDGGNINKDSSDVDKDCGNGNDVDKDSSDGSDINKDDGDNKDGGDNTDDDNKDDSDNKDGGDNTDDDNKDDGDNKDGGDNTDDNDKDDNKDDGDNKDGSDNRDNNDKDDNKDDGDNKDGSNKTDNDKDDNDNKDDRDNKDEKDDEDDEDNKALPMWKETI